MTKTILVVGANGYIGSHVLRSLAQNDGVRIIAVDTQAANAPSNCEQLIANVLADDFSLADALGDIVPDACLHLAWRNGFDHASPTHIEDIPKHFAFLRQVIELGVPQLAVMGSMHEIGYWEGMITAETPCNPQSFYGVAKNTLRQLMQIECQKTGCDLQWLRAFYIVGDDLHSQSVFGKIARAALDGATTFPFVTGEKQYDFIDVDVLADQIATVLLHPEVSGIVHCCSGYALSLREKAESFIQEHGYDIALQYGVYPDRVYDSPAVWGDSALIDSLMSEAS